MINTVNKAWSWQGFTATEIIQSNEFGNIVFKTVENEYWRICPEELDCEKIAISDEEWKKLSKDVEFLEDWNMTDLIQLAKTAVGDLEEGQKYCLKMPAVFGGEYELSNLGKISFTELIQASGNFGFQIKDVKDGEEVKINIVE